MGVSNRGLRKIVVDDIEYRWGVRMEMGGYDYLVIVTDAKDFYFKRELSWWDHNYYKRWEEENRPPEPKTKSKLTDPNAANYQSRFSITPSYVERVIRWCIENGFETGNPP